MTPRARSFLRLTGRPRRGKNGGSRIAALFALAAALLAAPFAATAPAAADVNDFTYDSWHVDYEISRDADGRAIARVQETIVARFPDHDQNRGIVLGKPVMYENASTDPRDFAVTDGTGAAVPFELEHDSGFVAVLTGDDEYVHGQQTYVISYSLSDVILARDDGTADEFYWDLLDTEHAQPIASFSATVSFAANLTGSLNGNIACYAGAAEASSACAFSGTGAEHDPVTVQPMPKGPHEGVTIAIGLAPGTFVQPSSRIPNPALDYGPLALGVGALALSGSGLSTVAVMRRRRRQFRGTVVAQYDVPPALPPLVAGPVAGASGNSAAAEIVHLAVNGVIRIEQPESERGFLGFKKEGRPTLRLLDPGLAADPLDAQTVEEIFGSGAKGGTAFEVPESSEAFAKSMSGLQSTGDAEAVNRGYFALERSRAGRLLGILAVAIGASAIGLGIWGLVSRGAGAPLLGVVLGGIAAVLGFVSLTRHRVHTESGAETREYLLGVREFIRVAEKDRIAMLQSVAGAERRADGELEVIHLYERLLPYAMLFGLQKDWGRVLEARYEATPGYVPLWYPGVAAVGLANFGSTIESFTSSLSSSVSYTSSSAGGSGGGGFVGGGGGGGFSGGR